jgi:Helix-turn-helix domain
LQVLHIMCRLLHMKKLRSENSPARGSTISVLEFSRRSGLHRNTISQWLAAGKIQGRKGNRDWQIPVSELERLLERRLDSEPEERKKELTGRLEASSRGFLQATRLVAQSAARHFAADPSDELLAWLRWSIGQYEDWKRISSIVDAEGSIPAVAAIRELTEHDDSPRPPVPKVIFEEEPVTSVTKRRSRKRKKRLARRGGKRG